ncbi:MAG TPA: hypothetical protein VIM64_06800 [Puia sp.]
MKSLSEYIEDSIHDLRGFVGPDIAQRLDLSESSLSLVEDILADLVGHFGAYDAEQRQRIVELFGCYILEVGRNAFGGHYVWHPDQQAPVLIVGDLDKHVGMLTWPKVAGRLMGDEGDNIPFFYEGFAERAKGPAPDEGILYV